jgi:hypothetical protein
MAAVGRLLRGAFACHPRRPDEDAHMQATVHPAIPWPGFSPERSLVLPLQAARMDTPFGQCCRIDGLRLERKSEFHLTVLDRAMCRAAAAELGEAGLRVLYESLPWTPRRTGRYVLLHRNRPGGTGSPDAWSLIEHLELPAMHAFRGELARVSGPRFADPVPHVTHFACGDPGGIGVADARALHALRVRDVVP